MAGFLNTASDWQQLQQTGGYFNNASNILVNNCQLNQYNQGIFASQKGGFGLLKEHVASSAFHDSVQRVDPPRCHPNTREAVLDHIIAWILQTVTRTTWLMWLNGATGAGKSAIAQSIAEICVERNIPVASFFFMHTDSTRNAITNLAATLAYQLIQILPAVSNLIIRTVEANPLIFQQSLETQLNKLIIQPLQQVAPNPAWKLLLIIDGVDECRRHGDQTNLIRIIAKVLETKDLPLIVLFSSRAETHLMTAFRSSKVAPILLPLPLDDHYQPDSDIRMFLYDQFDEIKQTHHLSHLLDPNWPPPPVVEEIVQKSSGQFIYASVVTRFISSPRFHPAQQLDIVRGLRPSGFLTPFAQLDTLYRHIFSQIQNQQLATTILAFTLLTKEPRIPDVAYLLNMEKHDIYIALADLPSVVLCENDMIRFLHASLPDFLFNKMRSKEYHISIHDWSTRLSISMIRSVAAARLRGVASWTLLNLLKYAEGSPELRDGILAHNPFQNMEGLARYGFEEYLTIIQRLDFGDSGEIYRHQLKIATRFLKTEYPWLLDRIQDSHDISQILADME